MDRWVFEAVNKINADAHRSADTHLFKLSIPSLDGVDIYLKDENTHPTGSLKHRLARSLFFMGFVTARSGKVPRSLKRPPAARRSQKPILRG